MTESAGERVPTVVELNVPAGYSDSGRLDRYITGFVMNATRAKVQRAIREGHVSVNGRVEKRPAYSVSAGDHISCTVWKQPPIRIEPEDIPLSVVFEDDHVIVVDKPAGMVVHPAYGHRSGTLVNALLYHVGAGAIEADEEDSSEEDGDEEMDAPTGGASYRTVDSPTAETRFDAHLSTLGGELSGERAVGGAHSIRPGIVHRLDKDTSGLMVIAKNDVAHVRLARQFESRTIHRTYLAVVWGNPPDDGSVDAPIGRSNRDRKKMAVVKGGKSARTHYRVLRRWAHLSVLELRLDTGRTHQIRVHLAHVGHPVLGDVTYGGDEIRSGPDTRNRRAFFRNVFGILPRQALHARRLEFVHPASGENVGFESPVPDDIASVVDRLKRDH